MEGVDREFTADLLIVGGGGAGLRAAIEAAGAGARVILASKAPLCRSGATVTASFSIQAAFHSGDSSRLHFEDTVRVGRGLADEHLVKALAEDAPRRMLELSEMGTPFERLEGGSFRQVQMAGQSAPRSLVISRCAYSMAVALARELARHGKVEIWEDAMAVSLLSGSGKVSGALVFDLRTGELSLVRAGAVLLATGGYMALWSFNDAPPDVTGDGQVLAFRAGAELVDLEMMQFYPTVICHPPGARGLLFSYDRVLHPEMLGGRVTNGRGETFFEGRPTRDELLRLILREVAEGRGSPHGGVFIDLTQSPHPPSHLDRMLRQSPAAFGLMRQLGVDVRKKPFEVAPGAHFACGGVRMDENGATARPGLFVAGEVGGNLQGANRISGNALTETQVFAVRAARAALRELKLEAPDGDELEEKVRGLRALLSRKGGGDTSPRELKRKVQKLLWEGAGPVREEGRLSRALRRIEELRERELPHLRVDFRENYSLSLREALEVEAMLELGRLVMLSARERRESRGCHLREDFTEQDESWARHLALRQGKEGPELRREPVRTLGPEEAPARG